MHEAVNRSTPGSGARGSSAEQLRRDSPASPARLRHSYATAALAAGVPAKIVSERLGHASIALTLDTYSHVLPNMQEQAAEQRSARPGHSAKHREAPGLLRRE